MSYSKKYRERTIEYRQAGHTLEETHQTFKVSGSTIQEWEKQLEETGDMGKKGLHRGFRKIDPEKLKAYVAEHPDAYQSEMAEAFGCSESGIRDALKRHKITREKRQRAIKSRISKKQQRIRTKFRACHQKRLPMWMNVALIHTCTGNTGVRCGDSSLFEFWFSNQLLPSLDKGTVIVMDNAAFHSKKRLLSAAQIAGCKLLFFPPYSPELSPIEKFWARLKRFLHKILPAASSFDDALFTAF